MFFVFCTIKSRSSLLAPAHPDDPGKRAVKRLWWYFVYLGIFGLLAGSIVRSAKRRLFKLLRGRFWGFSPSRGDMLHQWGWNLAWRRTFQISPPSVQW